MELLQIKMVASEKVMFPENGIHDQLMVNMVLGEQDIIIIVEAREI